MKASPQGISRTLATAVVIAACALQLRGQTIDTARLFAKDSAAVVLIVTHKSGAALAQGIGVLVSNNGLIISALHVVEEADSAIVKLKSGDVYDNVSVVAFDARRDLVVLKISGFDLSTVPLGNSNEVKEGDPVAMISNPQGLEGSITQGIVSAIRDVGDLGYRAIQTTVPASHGSSGGAILNANGELIAVLSFKIVGGENLNFGIPVNYARGLLDSRENFPLSDLASRLAQDPIKPLSRILETTPQDISGQWQSLASGSKFKVRVQDGHAYVERELSDEQTKAGMFELCDLTNTQARYDGTCKAQGIGRWYDRWRYQWRTRTCEFQGKMEFDRYSPLRIEGRAEVKGKGEKWSDKDQSNCGARFPVVWQEFVWIRPE